ncbi:hypothetical protein ACRAWF_15365 [Streptomyces sp. L7]
MELLQDDADAQLLSGRTPLGRVFSEHKAMFQALSGVPAPSAGLLPCCTGT